MNQIKNSKEKNLTLFTQTKQINRRSLFNLMKDGTKCIAVELEGNEFAELNNCHVNDKTKKY